MSQSAHELLTRETLGHAVADRLASGGSTGSTSFVISEQRDSQPTVECPHLHLPTEAYRGKEAEGARIRPRGTHDVALLLTSHDYYPGSGPCSIDYPTFIAPAMLHSHPLHLLPSGQVTQSEIDYSLQVH